MKSIRLIGRLDIKNSNLIKPINLEGLRIVGDPNLFAKDYYNQGIDELIFMDTVATLYGRNYLSEIIKKITKDVFIPITVGGGIRNLSDAKHILNCGADKVAINTAAVNEPKFISRLADSIGSQSIVLSIEAKKKDIENWEVYISNGREPTGLNVLNWIEQGIKLGAGEIFLTSIDKEGTRRGYDVELMKNASKVCEIPLIASGGLGKISHLLEVIDEGNVDAVAVADALHYKRLKIDDLKKAILQNNSD